MYLGAAYLVHFATRSIWSAPSDSNICGLIHSVLYKTTAKTGHMRQ
ncbi:hypothetical protein CKAH01_06807 [Colletotrichum kahawae]|uniref:Uncharacterized protein n=1 Tax=Colletotrichum kahawae TaxID=34407 RepID=A0AAE0D260_COLKA|nr:hypothetical protein CKAH01_06807 [Colletotrichum kahawae]